MMVFSVVQGFFARTCGTEYAMTQGTKQRPESSLLVGFRYERGLKSSTASTLLLEFTLVLSFHPHIFSFLTRTGHRSHNL